MVVIVGLLSELEVLNCFELKILVDSVNLIDVEDVTKLFIVVSKPAVCAMCFDISFWVVVKSVSLLVIEGVKDSEVVIVLELGEKLFNGTEEEIETVIDSVAFKEFFSEKIVDRIVELITVEFKSLKDEKLLIVV